MRYFLDEIRIVSENRDPIPFEEAVVHGTEGKTFVFVSHTVNLSENLFEVCKRLYPPAMVRRLKRRYILLEDDAELRFLTEDEIEHNALRGIGKVVWVE